MQSIIDSASHLLNRDRSHFSDPVMLSASNALNSENDFEAVNRIIFSASMTYESKEILIPCLLSSIMSIVYQRRSIAFIENLEDVPNIQSLRELLKTCKDKGYQFDSSLASFVLALTPLVALLYLELDINIDKGLKSTGQNLFNLGALTPHHTHAERLFDLAIKKQSAQNKKQALSNSSLDHLSYWDDWDNTPLHNIIANEAFERLKLFLRKCREAGRLLDLTVKDKEGKNPLLLATKMRDTKTFCYLIEQSKRYPTLFKFDIDARDDFGRSGLHYACMLKESRMIEVYLKNGANYHKKDNQGLRPIDYLLMQNKKNASESLRTVAINPERRAKSYEFPSTREASLVDQLLSCFCIKKKSSKTVIEVCFSDECLTSSCIAALKEGMLEADKDKEHAFRCISNMETDETQALQALVDAGTDINASGPSKNTALHRAAKKGNSTHVKWLLEQGAKQEENAEEQTPSDVAATQEIKQMLTAAFQARFHP